MNVLLDTNVVLDVLLKRDPWLADSQAVWQASDDGLITGYLMAAALTDIFYIARRLTGRDKARQAIVLCMTAFRICPVDRAVLEQALLLPGDDFEDAVQIAAAMHVGLDAIVTRNPTDFSGTPMLVMSPSTLIVRLQQGSDFAE
ncbi:MAG TPA: PIN domain-containing protein [Herpetosiphonaceae bacterium]|nr:PIN domain-containing protein [Herpetosiphonaceae bacterium]